MELELNNHLPKKIVSLDFDSTVSLRETLVAGFRKLLKQTGYTERKALDAIERKLLKITNQCMAREDGKLIDSIDQRLRYVRILLEKKGVKFTNELLGQALREIGEEEKSNLVNGYQDVDGELGLINKNSDFFRFIITSGGDRRSIIPAARSLNISEEDIIASYIVLDDKGFLDREKSVIVDDKARFIRDQIAEKITLAVGDGGSDFNIYFEGVAKKMALCLMVVNPERRLNLIALSQNREHVSCCRIIERMDQLQDFLNHIQEEKTKIVINTTVSNEEKEALAAPVKTQVA